jgi:hypothetical protein
MDRAQPGARGSTNRNIEFGETTGQYTDGWIVPADEPTLSAQRYTSFDETVFSEFDADYSSESLTVTIAPGEGFVDGWVARDSETSIELESDMKDQFIVLGWDPDAVYDDHEHSARDEADRVIVAHNRDVDSKHPTVAIWMFDTSASGVATAIDLRNIGPNLKEGIVDSQAIDRSSLSVNNPDRYQSAKLDDGSSYEVPVQVPAGATLSVYRWGAYDANTSSAPSGLNVELLDENDTVEKSANTADTQQDSPIVELENTSDQRTVYILRAKNDTGDTLGGEDDSRGVGMHFGYLVIE